MEIKVQETFSLMKRSSKVNKLIKDSLTSISNEYEVSSAQKGAWGQDMARKRLRSDAYKMEHQKKGNLTNLYMKEVRATDATRLESILEAKWYDDKKNFRVISKISPSGTDRINRIL